MKLLPSRPAWMKNITRRMIVIWSVSFVAFLVIGFGTVALSLGLSPVAYSPIIDSNKVWAIQYMNEQHSKQLFNKDDIRHNKPMNDILRLLNNGGKTNQLENLFRGNPEMIVENNTSSSPNIQLTSTFSSVYSKNAIIINFSTPQYNVDGRREDTRFNLTTYPTANSDPVYRIMIPLDNASNEFQKQTWYLLTFDPTTFSAGQSLSISKRITTYGNYHELGNYIKDLHVRF